MTSNDILFVIVLYKESLCESSSFRTITNSLKKNIHKDERGLLYVYDNSPVSQVVQEHPLWNIIWVKDPANSGLSTAYNKAAKVALQNSKKWLFLMDQDSTFPLGTIEEYVRMINLNRDIYLFSLIVKIKDGRIMSPYKKKMKWGKFINDASSGIYNLQKFGVINTGLCIRLDIFNASGGYNEKVKIDGADFQFLERVSSVISNFYVVNIIAQQRFSLFELDKDKLAERYRVFLADVCNFDKNSIYDKFFYKILIVKRTLRLTFDTRSTNFFKILFSNK